MSTPKLLGRARGDVRRQKLGRRLARRWFACVLFSMNALALGSLRAELDAEAGDEEEKRPSAALKAMHERAAAVKVFSVNHPDRPIKLLAKPVLRYSDPDINIVDASVWAYSDGGRPQALVKIEAHLWNGDALPRVTWVHCFVSTSSELIGSAWPNALQFNATQPGLSLKAFPKAPRPAESKAERLTQMNVLAKRFSVHSIDESQKDLELQLLPARPVYRYADPQAHILDGAAFAFVATGTNPSLVLLVELSQSQGEEPKWHYSLSRMTVREMTVKLDEQVVLKQAFAGRGPGQQPTWMWFPQKGILPDEPEK